MRYGAWTIVRDPKPIPDRRHDWDYVHDDYGGPGDDRCGTAASVLEALIRIEEIEAERAERARREVSPAPSSLLASGGVTEGASAGAGPVAMTGHCLAEMRPTATLTNR